MELWEGSFSNIHSSSQQPLYWRQGNRSAGHQNKERAASVPSVIYKVTRNYISLFDEFTAQFPKSGRERLERRFAFEGISWRIFPTEMPRRLFRVPGNRKCSTKVNALFKTLLTLYFFCRFEHYVQRWMQAIQELILESEQLRLETHTEGPQDEIEFWKCRNAKLTLLVEQISSEPCRMTIATLKVADSKFVKVGSY